VWRKVPRAPRRERIDPFTLAEPWRRFVQEALQARTRFAEAVTRAPDGPLRDHLAEIAARIETGVDECWLVARRGQTLVEARRGIDVTDVDRQLARLTGGEVDAAGPARDRVIEALRAQRATADRLDGVIDQARSELRLLDARLDEAVARSLELSASASVKGSMRSRRGARGTLRHTLTNQAARPSGTAAHRGAPATTAAAATTTASRMPIGDVTARAPWGVNSRSRNEVGGIAAVHVTRHRAGADASRRGPVSRRSARARPSPRSARRPTPCRCRPR